MTPNATVPPPARKKIDLRAGLLKDGVRRTLKRPTDRPRCGQSNKEKK